jgi:hypothetical protein
MLWWWLVTSLCIPAALLADEVVLRDGTVVTGDVVDYRSGHYAVQIGRFRKWIPESDVQDIRGVQPPAAAAGAAAAAPTAPGGVPATAPAPGAGAAVAGLTGDAVSGMMRQLGIDPKSLTESLRTGGPTATLQQLMRQADPAQLQELQRNPLMQQLVDRFKDPAYQKQLLESLTILSEKMNPGQPNPMLGQVRMLLDQLNQAGASGPPTGAADPAIRSRAR